MEYQETNVDDYEPETPRVHFADQVWSYPAACHLSRALFSLSLTNLMSNESGRKVIFPIRSSRLSCVLTVCSL